MYYFAIRKGNEVQNSNRKKPSGTYIIFKIPANENTPSCPEMQIWTPVSINAITGPAYL